MRSRKVKTTDVGVTAGRGTCATDRIEQGEVVWELDPEVPVLSLAELQSLSVEDGSRYSQIAGDRFYANTEDEWAWNHACDPNCGGTEGSRMRALRTILPGEELTYDYGFCEITHAWRILCACPSSRCRRIVSNKDYLLKSVQEQYAGQTRGYVQEAIDRASLWEIVYHRVWSFLWRMRLALSAGAGAG